MFGRLGATEYNALSEELLLENARKLVVIRRNKLANMWQGSYDTPLSFVTRLKPVSRTGKFKVSVVGICTCGSHVPVELNYTDQMVLDNFVRSLADKESKTKVFALQEEDCTADNILKVVEAKELGRSSVKDTKHLSDVQTLSSYKRI